MHTWDNQAIAEKLLEIADLLEQQNANPFRVGAYRRAAHWIPSRCFNPSRASAPGWPGTSTTRLRSRPWRSWNWPRTTAAWSRCRVSARAHDLGKTDDWVVLYFHTDHGPEAQRTVVTETSGGLQGRRVVRGREAECARHYA
jgi:hypothetical protein